MIKNSKKLVFHLNVFGHGDSNPVLLRIHLFPEFTKIDFGYITTNMYINGGWIKIAADTFIENVATKERYTLIKAEGITIAPAKHNFKSKKDWQYFSLYFPPVKQKDMTLNIIEKVKGNKHDFNYYNIELKITDGIEVI
ncbi:hypothetical protein [Flavobacterium aciduliphilum]|uniref:Uncharacterized protein n=1 Tax=Flavobacterium aciduliphilum TaxID=1101402 RepID=A0A328YL22_9FLAO|nr:hypothetical protein [Flavobacterium aciduliphilum]RAR73793.1 hypothetical protein CLV55_103112 [Flavobacterium aciduliphilum]